MEEIDRFRESVIAAHAGNWRLLRAAAQSYVDFDHHGFMIAGEFQRGGHRGGGEHAGALERDRVRALQLMRQAMPLVEREPDRAEAAGFYLGFAAMVSGQGGTPQAFRLHALTDLDALPDYEAGYDFGRRFGQSASGATVDAEGRPLFHRVPERFESARTDGERWRWLLQRAGELDPGAKARAVMTYAAFLHELLGVQTLREYGPLFYGRGSDGAGDAKAAGPYAVHTLTDSESMAKLAVGVRRFALPEGHNFIRLLEEASGMPDTGVAAEATARLAGIYENRRQYERALAYWERYQQIRQSDGPGTQIDQIAGSWGAFESAGVHPSDRRPSVDYRFATARKVEFEAYRVRLDKLIQDVKDYVRSRPERLDWNRLNLNDIGRRLVYENQAEYIGERVAGWALTLDPDPRHWDRRVTVEPARGAAGRGRLPADGENRATATSAGSSFSRPTL